MRAKFITFEGGEGTGKSTQAKLLAERLAGHDIECVATREPGGSPFAEQIRDVLLSRQTAAHEPIAQCLLFYAARADHLARTIRPALDDGKWVICDRFSDSTRVYQGAGGGLADEKISALEALVVAPTQPDLTLILDMPAAQGLARAQARRIESAAASAGASAPDNFEGRDEAFHRAIRDGFLAIARKEPQRCVVIDAGLAVNEIAGKVWAAVSARLIAGEG